MITKETFLEKLRLERKWKGYSVEKMAKELGWEKQTLSDIEKGKRDITVMEFLQFCDTLSISPGGALLFIDIADNVMHKRVFQKLRRMNSKEAAIVNMFCNVIFVAENAKQAG